MSHFTEVAVEFDQKHEKIFISALEEVFGQGNVEFHADASLENRASHLFGFSGDNRSVRLPGDSDYAPPCHVIIRRKHVGALANDIGYRRAENGKYTAYISEYDARSTFPVKKREKVAQNYAVQVAEKELRTKGYTTSRQVLENGAIRVTGTTYG
jgi:hypothetical protein